jgi:RNA polymerase sigma factor (sigma-70 family)
MSDAQLLAGFLSESDDGAFEQLVHRHGPMVLRVCRDLLSDPHDCEDAFQATFLVFVRRAGSIRDRDSVGRWLYGVAHRIALRARAQGTRRRLRERQVPEMTAAGRPQEEAERAELRPLVHAELSRLPEKLRAPLILCYMEGNSYEEAARRLRLPLGTLKDRLERGRELVRTRLRRRGVVASSMLLLFLLSEGAEAMPADLVSATVSSGVLAAHKRAVPQTIPRSVAALVERELAATSLRQLSWVGAAVVTALVAGFVLLALAPIGRHAPAAQAADGPAPVQAVAPEREPGASDGSHRPSRAELRAEGVQLGCGASTD